MSILNIDQLENIISDKELTDLRKFFINSKWNNKMPGGFVTNFPQRLVNTYGNGMSINDKGELYGHKWDTTFWTAKQTQNNVSLETKTEPLPKCLLNIIPLLRNHLQKKYPDAIINDNTFSIAVCNNYTDPTMTISAHTDDQEWYPPTINGNPIFASLTFYPDGKPIRDKYYSRFQIKKEKWEDVKLEDNSIMIMSANTPHRVLKHKKNDIPYFKQRINITLRCTYELKQNPLMNYISVANHSRYYKAPISLVSNIKKELVEDMLDKYNDFCKLNNYDLINYINNSEHDNKIEYVTLYKIYIKKCKYMNVRFKCNIVTEALIDVCNYIENNVLN